MNRFLEYGVIPRPLFSPDGDAGADAAVKEPVAGAEEAAGGDKTDAGSGGTTQTDKAAASADAGDKDKGGKSALASGADDDAGGDKTPATWPEDWRAKLAGDDKDFAKQLERFGSPADLAKSFKEAQKTIRSGKVKAEMPDPEDADAMKAWRKDNGIPEDATAYVIPETIKEYVTDDDKPMLNSFTEFAHEKNLPQAAMDTALEWYFQQQETIASEQASKDKAASEATTEALRSEYGREYKANMQLAKDFMAATPEIGDQWTEARLPDGRRLGDIPEFVMHIAEQGRAKYGDTAFSNPDAEAQHNSRKAEIEKIRDTDFDRYEAEGLDKEMRTILEKEAKRKR